MMYLFMRAEHFYPKLSQNDPLRQNFVRYANNLWRNYQSNFIPDCIDDYMAEKNPELWKDMKAYKEKVPVDVYESWKLNSGGFR